MFGSQPTRRGFLDRLKNILVSLQMINVKMPLSSVIVREPSLLDEIIAHPDDDRPRLRYADWLLNEGDQMGKFIRMQCDVARLDETDPRWYAQRYLLANQLHGCARGFNDPDSDQMVEDIANVESTQAGSVAFDRGMVEELHVYDVELFLATQDDVFSAAPLLRHLHFEEMNEDEYGQWVRNLCRCKYLNRIKSMEFEECDFGDKGLSLLASCPALKQLKKLELSDCTLGPAGLQPLTNSSILRELEGFSLGGCTFGTCDEELPAEEVEEQVDGLLRSPVLHGVQQLEIYNSFSRANLDTLIAGDRLPLLTKLELASSELTGEDYEALLAAPLMRPLRSLELRSQGENDPFAIDLSQCSQLERCRFFPPDYASVERLVETAPTSLRILDLRNGQITDAGVALLAGCRNLASLRCLYIGSNQITAVGAEHLAKSSVLTQLVALKMPWNRIGADGARTLVNSPVASSLRFLNLADNGLGDEGAQAIASAGNLRNLAWLDLDDNAIGPRGAQALLASNNLRNLVAFRILSNPLEELTDDLKNRFGDTTVDSYWLGYLI